MSTLRRPSICRSTISGLIAPFLRIDAVEGYPRVASHLFGGDAGVIHRVSAHVSRMRRKVSHRQRSPHGDRTVAVAYVVTPLSDCAGRWVSAAPEARNARWRRSIEARAVDKGVEATAVDADLGNQVARVCVKRTLSG